MTSFELMALIDACSDARAILRAYRVAWKKRPDNDDESILLVEMLRSGLGPNYMKVGQPGYRLLFDAWADELAPRKIRWRVYRHVFGEAVDEGIR